MQNKTLLEIKKDKPHFECKWTEAMLESNWNGNVDTGGNFKILLIEKKVVFSIIGIDITLSNPLFERHRIDVA